MTRAGHPLRAIDLRHAAGWFIPRLRYAPLSVAWGGVAYIAATWVLGLAPWSALVLTAGAWVAGVDFLSKFAAVSPPSSIQWSMLRLPWRLFAIPFAALFAVHALTTSWPSALSNLASAGVAAGLYWARAHANTIPLERHHRGRRRLDQAPAAETAHQHGKDARAVNWGGVTLPAKAMTDHTVFVGVHGSGKTLSIRMLMQQLLALVRPASDSRALIYDADLDMIPYLAALKHTAADGSHTPVLDPGTQVITLNPFDARGYAWDIAGDVTTDATAMEVASILLPLDRADHDKFFAPTAQQIVRRVMMALHYANPGQWTLKDLVDAVQTEDDIRRVLESCPHTERYVATYLSSPSTDREDRQARGIVATVATNMAVYEPVAALWQKTIQEGERAGERRRVSMKEWSEQPLIVLLGTYDARSATLARINQTLFNLAARYALSQPVDPLDMRRSLFVIDEVRRIERLDKLSDLLTNGRKRGAVVIMGFQDIEGLRHAYQPQIAHEVIGQCGNVAFFRLSDETARWAEGFIGQSERITRSHTDNGKGLSTSEGINARPLVMASELSALPKAGPQHGLHGYYLSQYVDGVYFHATDWQEVMAAVVDPRAAAIDDEDRVGFLRRPDEDEQYYTHDGDRAFRPPDPL